MNVLVLLGVLYGVFDVLSAQFEIGVGIADVTGPIVEIGLMGYGKFDQVGTGLHLRQFARTFIIKDKNNKALVFVNVDVCMIGDGLRLNVLRELKKSYGSLYTSKNVMISGTHTHSAPGGHLMHFLFDLPTRGFSQETFDALRNGILQSIKMAHRGLTKGRIFVSMGELLNANINRSPTAYMKNPRDERKKYSHNTDTTMYQLKFVSRSGEPLGVINWFPVHPTSMNNSNTLISSDNVGYASIKFEKRMNLNNLLGNGPFVAAFAASNLGDVSPNIRGPKCQRTGKPCQTHTSTCTNGDICIASGPGKDMFQSTAIIADRLYKKALDLWESGGEEVIGSIRVIHQYIDMSEATAEVVTQHGNKIKVKGCLPAMGYSFAAGTTDGPGAFSFQQGTISSNPLWNLVRNILATPSRAMVKCQAPKPILLATGIMNFPFDWQPKVVSTQLALIGNVALVAVPGEFTTMAGRRMRDKIEDIMFEAGQENPVVIIAGLSNTYSSYITTFEEYQVQRYEGASTIFGPHTLNLYLAQYARLMNALIANITLDSGPEPLGLTRKMMTFIMPVVYDNPNIGTNFGNVTQQPDSPVQSGTTVTATFVAGNPRNHLMHGGTYCQVELNEGRDVWTVVATDANWETKVRWSRMNSLYGSSEIVVEWTIPDDVVPGWYRIKHYGSYKNLLKGVRSYEGTTRPFEVKSSPPSLCDSDENWKLILTRKKESRSVRYFNKAKRLTLRVKEYFFKIRFSYLMPDFRKHLKMLYKCYKHSGRPA